MPAPRGRKFTGVVNLYGGFHPPSPSPGNKYESLARGLLDFPESHLEEPSRLFDIRRNVSSICPDFCGELKVPFAIRDNTTRIRGGNLRDFPCVSRPTSARSFVRDHEFPRRRVCGDASCVSRVEGIFFAFSRSTRYFSYLLTLYRRTHNRRSVFLARRFKTSLSKARAQGSEQGLKANKRRYEFIYDDHDGGVYSCSCDSCLCTIRYRDASRRLPISRGNARQSGSPRRNWLRRISVRDGY